MGPKTLATDIVGLSLFLSASPCVSCNHNLCFRFDDLCSISPPLLPGAPDVGQMPVLSYQQFSKAFALMCVLSLLVYLSLCVSVYV